MRQGIGIAVIVSSLLGASAVLVLAQPAPGDGRGRLTQALQGAWLPLESGLVVSASEGTPLSAKYEIDDGAFELSVYTSKAGSSSPPTWRRTAAAATPPLPPSNSSRGTRPGVARNRQPR